MPEDAKSETGIVQSVADNLGAFFRHLLPGVLVIGAAYIAYPRWFSGITIDSWEHISVVAVVALTAGNVWFAVNRYGVKQFLDYLMYLANIPGPARGEHWLWYHNDLSVYVADSQCVAEIGRLARQHVKFRASSVLLLYIIGEIGFVFLIWHQPGTFFARHRCLVASVSAVVFAAGVWQDAITRRIDYQMVKSGSNRTVAETVATNNH